MAYVNYSKLTYHDKNSAYFGAKVKWGDALSGSSRTVTETPIPGQVANLYDNMNYDDTDLPITFLIDKPLAFSDWYQFMTEFEDWLTPSVINGHIQTEPFYFDLLSDYYVMGYIASAVTLTPDPSIHGDDVATATVTIRKEPWIYRRDGISYQPVPQVVYDTEIYPAKPLWHIVGNGDVTLTVNGNDYKFNGVDDEIYINSNRRLIYKTLDQDRSSKAVFPNNDFPVLKPGANTISTTGTITKFEYQPRWRRKY